MKTTLLAALAFAAAGAALGQTPPPAAPAKHKVVFQMNVADNDSWNQLFGNIGNAQKAFQKDGVEIEVVFYGKGITALLKTNTEFAELPAGATPLRPICADRSVLQTCGETVQVNE